MRREPIERLAEQLLDQHPPFLFRKREADYQALRDHFVDRLHVSSGCVFLVGSARFGFSLRPDAYGRQFSDASDVDVALVDQRLFDQIWHALLRWRYPWHLRRWRPSEQQWALQRLEEHMMGWCEPHRLQHQPFDRKEEIPTLKTLAFRWFDAFQSLGAKKTFMGRDFVGRLYRSKDHLVRYHVWGLELIKGKS